MSAHVSNSIPVSESNVELLSMETKPAQPATTTQLAVPGTQKPGLTIPPSPTLKKSGTFNTRSISDALASEAELREMKQREKIKKLFGLSVVVILILVVWALMFLPTVFFHVGQVNYVITVELLLKDTLEIRTLCNVPIMFPVISASGLLYE